MPPTLTYSIDENGVTIPTQAQLLTYLQYWFLQIYGVDLSTQSSSTPDNQMNNILIQMFLDVADLLVQINNFFDPDNAVGVILDQRVAINGIQRQGATFTTQFVSITVTQSLNLGGLDGSITPQYVVADAAGNQYNLVASQTGLTAGTYSLLFEAVNPGAVIPIQNTITVPVTVVLGVSAINNPLPYTTLGVNEESDYALKIRRQKSVALSSQGYLAGLYAALLNVPGVTYVNVHENVTGITDAFGVPGHSIWVIVAGTAANADIANAIYTKRNAGCGMFGSQSYSVLQVDGSHFSILWDIVITIPIFIRFTAFSLDGVTPPNIAAVTAGLPTLFLPGPGAEVNINDLATNVRQLDANTLVLSPGFSAGTTQILTLSGVAASGTFKIAYNGVSSASIAWNDAVGTIQTKVRAITGLSAVVVAGSIASQTLTFTLVAPVLGLLSVNTNSLATSGPVAITFSYNEGYANTLTPTTIQDQFDAVATNVLVLPMMLAGAPTTTGIGYVFSSNQVASTTLSIAHGGNTFQFNALGGYGAYTYSVFSGAGSISAGGLYTSSTAGTDVVKVVDSLGNTTTCTVTVT